VKGKFIKKFLSYFLCCVILCFLSFFLGMLISSNAISLSVAGVIYDESIYVDDMYIGDFAFRSCCCMRREFYQIHPAFGNSNSESSFRFRAAVTTMYTLIFTDIQH